MAQPQRQTGGRARALFFLALSGLAAIVAVGLIYQLVRSYKDQLEQAQQEVDVTVDVIVATHTLYQGQTLTDQDVAIKQFPPAFVPETVFHTMDEVVGRVPQERILDGEYLRKERLADPQAGVGLNAIVPKGMRALSINISDAPAVSGFLNPGNWVDILLTGTTSTHGIAVVTTQTVTMLQARKVLAVNARMSSDDAGDENTSGFSPSITLAVTPEEAERITQAKRAGQLTLTMRNDVDVTQVKTEGAKADKLIGRVDQPAAPIPKLPPRKATPQDRVLQLIHGQTITTEHIPSQGQPHP